MQCSREHFHFYVFPENPQGGTEISTYWHKIEVAQEFVKGPKFVLLDCMLK